MNNDDQERPSYGDRSSEDVYSKPVRAGKRTYFFDVKSTRDNSDYYLTITESKRKVEPDGSFSFEKHKIYLYKEDFDKFQEGLSDVLEYTRKNLIKDLPEKQADGKPGQEETAPAPEDSKDADHFTDVRFEEL